MTKVGAGGGGAVRDRGAGVQYPEIQHNEKNSATSQLLIWRSVTGDFALLNRSHSVLKVTFSATCVFALRRQAERGYSKG